MTGLSVASGCEGKVSKCSGTDRRRVQISECRMPADIMLLSVQLRSQGQAL